MRTISPCHIISVPESDAIRTSSKPFLLECFEIDFLDTLPVKKRIVAHSKIYLDRLLLWLRSAFAVELFRQAYAMSQRLFPSSVAFIFGRDF